MRAAQQQHAPDGGAGILSYEIVIGIGIEKRLENRALQLLTCDGRRGGQ
jgi:hypothetical protein